MRKKTFVAAAALCAIVAAGPIHAAEPLKPDTVFSRIMGLWQKHDLDAPFQSAEPLGDDGIVFRGIDIKDGSGFSLKTDTVAIAGLAPLGSDGFLAGRLKIGPVAIDIDAGEGKAFAVRIEPSGGSGLYLAPTGSDELHVSKTLPTAFKLGRLTATLDGREFLALAGFETTAWFDESGELLTMKSSIPELSITMDNAPAEVRGRMALLGLTNIAMAFRSSGSWNIATGRMTIDEHAIELKDAGTLTLSMELAGYTMDVYRRIREASQMAEKAGPGNGEAQLQAMARMMKAVGDIKLASAKLRFRDGALTRRLLAVQAEAMGATPQELAKSAPAMLDQPLARLSDPQLTGIIKSALAQFLADPGELTLDFAPASPVPVTEIVEAALNAPEKLRPMLGLNLTAS